LRRGRDWRFRWRGNVCGIAEGGSVLVSVPIAGSRLEQSQRIVACRMIHGHQFGSIYKVSVVAFIALSWRIEDDGRLTLLLWSCSKKPVVREDIGLTETRDFQA